MHHPLSKIILGARAGLACAGLLAALALATPAQAADTCTAIALRDVAAIGTAGSLLHKGQSLSDVAQYRVNKSTKLASLCAHGGYCYPAAALKLQNCKVGSKMPLNDPDEIFYSLD